MVLENVNVHTRDYRDILPYKLKSQCSLGYNTLTLIFSSGNGSNNKELQGMQKKKEGVEEGHPISK